MQMVFQYMQTVFHYMPKDRLHMQAVFQHVCKGFA